MRTWWKLFPIGMEKDHSWQRRYMVNSIKNLKPDAWRTEAIRNSQGLRDRLRRDWCFGPGRVRDELHEDGLIKFVTELMDGHRVESVILPLRTHQTLCISSQAGCRMGCRFCETGKLGLARSLSVEEMVGQVYQATKKFGRSIRNVVFMGMGEPFDNFENVIQAVRVLSDQRGLDIAQRRITLSTSGCIDGIEKAGGFKYATPEPYGFPECAQ